MVLDFDGKGLFGRGGNEFFESETEDALRPKVVAKLVDEEVWLIGSFGNWTSGTTTVGNQGINVGTYFSNNTPGSIFAIEGRVNTLEDNNTFEQCAIYQYTAPSGLVAVTGSVQISPMGKSWKMFNIIGGSVALPVGSYILTMNGKSTLAGKTEVATSGTATDRSSTFADAFPISVTPWGGAFTADYLVSMGAFYYLSGDTISLQNDDELFFAIEPDSYYTFGVNLNTIAGNTTQDMQLTMTGPTGAIGKFWSGLPVGIGSTETVQVGTSDTWVYLNGFIKTSKTAGKLQLQWAPNTMGSQYTRVQQGSWMTILKQ